jgi:hypothetical protein
VEFLGIKYKPYKLIFNNKERSIISSTESVKSGSTPNVYRDALSSSDMKIIKPDKTRVIGIMHLNLNEISEIKGLKEFKLAIKYNPTFNYDCIDEKKLIRLNKKFEELEYVVEDLNEIIDELDMEPLKYEYNEFFQKRLEYYNRYEASLKKIYSAEIHSNTIDVVIPN